MRAGAGTGNPFKIKDPAPLLPQIGLNRMMNFANHGGADRSIQHSTDNGWFRRRKAMMTLPLNQSAFLFISRICSAVDIRRLPPGFDFKNYVLRLLETKSPGLKAQVERMTDDELALLCREIVELRDLAS
jgi:hypothetical protein